MNSFERQNPDINKDIPLRKVPKIHKSILRRDSRVRGLAYVNKKGVEIPARSTGPNCRCRRLKCFDKVSDEEKAAILSKFNSFSSKNLQDSLLAGLISIYPPKQRRSRTRHLDNNTNEDREDSDSDLNQPLLRKNQHLASFNYKIRVNSREFPVCVKAFCSLHAVSNDRVRRIRNSLVKAGQSPLDLRGKHDNRPRKTPYNVLSAILDHIKSFKCTQSHYSRRDNPDVYYLPETLNVKKMFKMFIEENPGKRVSYKVYWKVFNTKFKLKFGVPKSDTCSSCDTMMQKLGICENEETRASLETERKLHLCKAEKCYTLKRLFKSEAKEQPHEYSCISMDYMQNLPFPHIRTNEVFYSIQMWYYVFGIHNEGNNTASMYCYDESIAKKGQNEVASLLFHYLKDNDLSRNTLYLISDGCAGQNKNYGLMKLLYILVHGLKMFKTIIHLFPVRGHSFLSNDRDFSLIERHKKKATVEIPQEWDNIIRNARENPSPFNLMNVSQNMIFNVVDTAAPYFLQQPRPPVKIKTARMLKYSINEPGFVLSRDSYSGEYNRSYIRNNKSLPMEFNFKQNYFEAIALKPTKIKHFLSLSQYLKKPENIAINNELIKRLQPNSEPSKSTDRNNVDLLDDDNSSGQSDVDTP